MTPEQLHKVRDTAAHGQRKPHFGGNLIYHKEHTMTGRMFPRMRIYI